MDRTWSKLADTSASDAIFAASSSLLGAVRCSITLGGLRARHQTAEQDEKKRHPVRETCAIAAPLVVHPARPRVHSVAGRQGAVTRLYQVARFAFVETTARRTLDPPAIRSRSP